MGTGNQFKVENLIEDLNSYRAELDKLTLSGIITKEDGRWRVQQAPFLWWLADHLAKTVRDDSTFEQWLRQEQLDGALTRKEKAQFGKALHAVQGAIGRGVNSFIEAYAKSLTGG